MKTHMIRILVGTLAGVWGLTAAATLAAGVVFADGGAWDLGDRLEASYTLASDDLYVRARVESDETAPFYTAGNTAALHPKVAMAWTQPYAGCRAGAWRDAPHLV